jgi:hypothetical protein
MAPAEMILEIPPAAEADKDERCSVGEQHAFQHWLWQAMEHRTDMVWADR